MQAIGVEISWASLQSFEKSLKMKSFSEFQLKSNAPFMCQEFWLYLGIEQKNMIMTDIKDPLAVTFAIRKNVIFCIKYYCPLKN